MTEARLQGSSSDLDQILGDIEVLRQDMIDAERRFADRWQPVPEGRRDSARNLLHYLAMRSHDLRPLQSELARLGLSSLGRAEPGALATIDAVRSVVQRLRGQHDETAAGDLPRIDIGAGRRLLREQTTALLGAAPAKRSVRIMVTMPSEAAEDYGLVRDLLSSGMDCMRINAAHDDELAWDRMLSHLDRARRELGKPCRVVMDMAGPKVRTGHVETAQAVARWRPIRNSFGSVIKPARLWFTSTERPAPAPEPGALLLPVPGAWLAAVTPGDSVKLFDARGAMRELTIIERTADGVIAESRQTAYVVSGTMLHVMGRSPVAPAQIGPLPPRPGWIWLKPGDTLLLSQDLDVGRPAVTNEVDEVLEPAMVGVTLPEMFDDLRVGEPIFLDDGQIGGVVRSVQSDRIQVEITRTKPGGAKLGSGKGINLPETHLRLPALTAKDCEDLRFIDGRADLVGYSFVRTDSDVALLQSHLERIGARKLGIVLKIETRKAFENLPSLLLAAMRSPSAGVMIARGDLAIECGYERLAEVQEQILWMAEASHTPVIWATQVLERLAKDGIPSRAEITDAAMAERAECVMLNKGPFIADAVRTLDNILRRMQAHQWKKSAMLRELGLAHRFLTAA